MADPQATRNSQRPSRVKAGRTLGPLEREARKPPFAVAAGVAQHPHADGVEALDGTTASHDEPCWGVHGLRTGLAAALLVALVVTGLSINRAVNDRQEKLVAQKHEEQNQAEATRLVEGLLAADTAQVSTSLASLKEFRTWADPDLQQAFKDLPADSNAKLHAGLGAGGGWSNR